MSLPRSLYCETARPAPETPALDGDRSVSVAIVGGGFTGLSTALHLAEHGVAVAVLNEAFLMAGQIIGLQAGYAYASTVDPATQADSGILVVFAQLIAGLLFFALGLDREVIRAFARSLDAFPAGSFVMTPASAEKILRLGAGIFSVGLRLAMPVLALLLLVDVAMALLGRLNQQIQLLILAFPVKMMATIALLAMMAVLFPRVYRGYAEQVLARVATAAGF